MAETRHVVSANIEPALTEYQRLRDQAINALRGIADTGDQLTTKFLTSVRAAALGITGLSQAEQSRAQISNRGLTDTTGKLAETQAAADNASQSLASMAIAPIDSEHLSQAVEKIQGLASLIPESLQTAIQSGLDTSESLFESLIDSVKTHILVAGAAVAVGLTAAVGGAIYAAYQGADFAVGLITGDSYKSENIEALRAANDEIKRTQEVLKVSAEHATVLNQTLIAQNVTFDTYRGTINSVAKAVNSNADELDRLGVAYETASGATLANDVVLRNALTVIQSYSEGWERHRAAVAIGLGSEKEIADALKISTTSLAQAQQRLIDYNLIIGPGTQKAVAEYEAAMHHFNNETSLTSQGFKRAIADNITPILTQLAEFFSEGFPFAVNVFRYTLATVTTLFYGLKESAYLVSEEIIGDISSISSVIGGMGSALLKVLQLDFAGAADEFGAGWQRAAVRQGQIEENMIAQSQTNLAAIKQAWGADNFDVSGIEGGAKKVGKAFEGAGQEVGVSLQHQIAALLDAQAAILAYADASEHATRDSTARDIAAEKYADLTIKQKNELLALADTVDQLTGKNKQLAEITTLINDTAKAERDAADILREGTTAINQYTDALGRVNAGKLQYLTVTEQQVYIEKAYARSIADANRSAASMADSLKVSTAAMQADILALESDSAAAKYNAEQKTKLALANSLASDSYKQAAIAAAQQADDVSKIGDVAKLAIDLESKNRSLGAELILDDRRRAAAQLQIEVDKYQKMIELGEEAYTRLASQNDAANTQQLAINRLALDRTKQDLEVFIEANRGKHLFAELKLFKGAETGFAEQIAKLKQTESALLSYRDAADHAKRAEVELETSIGKFRGIGGEQKEILLRLAGSADVLANRNKLLTDSFKNRTDAIKADHDAAAILVRGIGSVNAYTDALHAQTSGKLKNLSATEQQNYVSNAQLKVIADANKAVATHTDALNQANIALQADIAATQADGAATKYTAEQKTRLALAQGHANAEYRDAAIGAARYADTLAKIADASKQGQDLIERARGINAELILDDKRRAEAQLALEVAKYQKVIDTAKAANEKLAAENNAANAEKLAANRATLDQSQADLDAYIDAAQGKAQFDQFKSLVGSIDGAARDLFKNIGQDGDNTFKRLRQSLKSNLLDYLYEITIKPWIIQIAAQITGSGGIGGIGGIVSSAFGGNSSGGLGSVANLLSIGKTIYSGFSGALTSGITGSLGGFISSAGSLFGSSSIAAFGTGLANSANIAALTAAGAPAAAIAGAGGAGTGALGASVGGAASAIPIIGAIIAAAQFNQSNYAKGYRAENGFSGASIGAYTIPAVVIDKLLRNVGVSGSTASLFTGSANIARVFGRRTPEITNTSIRGEFSGSGFNGQIFAEWLAKGGWLRSDKRGVSVAPLDAAVAKQLTDGYNSVKAASIDFANILGINASAINDRTQTLNLTLHKEQEKNDQALADFFAGVSNTIALELLPSLTQFTQAGESASATLQRLAGNYQAVDAVLAALGKTPQQAFGKTGVASLQDREALLTASGGIETFLKNTDFFIKNFLTDAEQIAPIAKQVNDQLAAWGVTGVTTSEQFKRLAQGQDLATSAGRDLFAKLTAIAPQFKQVADYEVQLAKARDDAAQATQQAAQAEAQAARERAQIILDEQHQLRIDLLIAQGETAKATALQRADELAALKSDLARSLQEQIYAANDATAARQAQEQANAQRQQRIDAERQAQAQASAQRQQRIDAARSALSNAYQREADALQSVVQGKLAEAEATRKQRDALKISALTTLDPGQQYAEAQRQFRAASNAEKGNAAQTLLQASRVYNASTAAYAADFDYVQQALSDSALASENSANIAAQQLAQLNLSVDGLAAIDRNLIKVDASVISVRDALQNLTLAANEPSYVTGPSGAIAGGDRDTRPLHLRFPGTSPVIVNGSHSLGKERIPFDNYLANLHRGERVQTRAQVEQDDAIKTENAGSVREIVREQQADKIQRAEVARQTLSKLDGVIAGVQALRREIMRAA